jgi:putative transposase
MKSVRLDYPMGLLCRAFGVSRSGFYAWLNRAPSPRVQEDERLKVAIKAVHVQTRETYGPLRVQPELAAQGFEAGRDRIVRLRHELGLRCKQKRKFKATTNSRHNFPVAENLLNQTFAPTRPNEAWVTEIVCTQMTKTNVFALRGRRNDIANFNVVVCNDNAID